MDYNAFKTRCKEKGYSPSSLVADLGLSKSNVTNWKHGGNPSYAVLIQISQKLECTVGFLLGEEHSDNGVGAVVSQELWGNELTSARTISLEIGSPLKDEYLNEIAVFANCSILFLCGYEKKFVERQSCRTTANISERSWDKMLAIFDNINDNPIIANIQMQLSRIVLHNLGQYRTKSVWRLCTPSACKFSVILPRNPLPYGSMPAEFLGNLTKNLTTHLSHNLCAVLP